MYTYMGITCSSDPLVACCNEFALCMLWSGADQKPLTLEDDNYSHVFAKFPNSFLQNNVHDIQFVEKKNTSITKLVLKS